MQIFRYESTPFQYGVYVIQFMQEGNHTPFHAAVRHTKTGEETTFKNLLDLLQFLRRQR